ncbi:MAG: hypothetical protein DMG06_18790, partial [Acidobacteria bacterium]
MRQPPSWPEAMRRSGESHIAVHPAVEPQESLEARRGKRVRGLSIPANFLWSLTGNVTYALTQWGIVIALAKWTNAFMIGQFSLGLAIATPVLMFTNLQLRVVQASDARRLYSFGEYLGLRMVTTLMGLVIIAVIAFASGYHPRTAMVILAVGAAKAVESLSDAYYGLFQLDERLDRVGKSMMLKGVASMAGLCSGLLIGKDVLWG